MPNTTNPSLLASLRLAKAMALARRGKWREAEVAITDGNSDLSDPVALQAVAALVTSEGDYVRALKLWEQLQRIDPQNEEARRMVPAIELWLTRPSWAPYFPYIAGALGAVILALFLYFALSTPAELTVPPHSMPTSADPSAGSTTSPNGLASASSGAQTVPESVAAPTPIPVISFPTAAAPTSAPSRHRKSR